MQDNNMNILKKSAAAVASVSLATAVFAQPAQQAPHPLEHAFADQYNRTEIYIPLLSNMIVIISFVNSRQVYQ